MCGLEVAKRKVAALRQNNDPQPGWMITKGYVAEGSGGGDSEDVDRLIEEEVWDESSQPTYTGTVSWILELGDFKVKVMVRDEETCLQSLSICISMSLSLKSSCH